MRTHWRALSEPQGEASATTGVKAWIQEGQTLWDAAASGGRGESPRDGQGAVSLHQRGPGGGGLGWQCSCVCHPVLPPQSSSPLGPTPPMSSPRGHRLPASCTSQHWPEDHAPLLETGRAPRPRSAPQRSLPLPPPPKAVDGVLHVPRTGTSPQATGLFGGAGGSSPRPDAEAGTALESTLPPRNLTVRETEEPAAKDNRHRKLRKY